MKEKKTTLSLKDIERLYFEEKLRRLQGGFSLKLKRTKPRDPEKRQALIEFIIKSIPSAQDILSGKAFSELFRKG
jgi:predicted ATP-dependent protease